jgi:hypothetical protein|tara:strand:- start:267 stop:479 length:213 start_codon:yes stop_codon:yes gene_type:complete
MMIMSKIAAKTTRAHPIAVPRLRARCSPMAKRMKNIMSDIHPIALHGRIPKPYLLGANQRAMLQKQLKAS